jgi:alpha-glucosidase
LRYRLLPYIYTNTEETTRTGIPLMRPIFLEYPQAAEFYSDDHDFLFGPDLFVSPVVSETTDPQGVYLPPGEWFDFWTAEKHTNKDQIKLNPRLDEVPLYVRAGAIVPMQPLVQSTSEKPSGPLQLRAYLPTSTAGPDAAVNACRGSLYADDGHTFAYQKGEILRINYSCQVASGSASLTSNVEMNSYQSWWKSAEITLFGLTSVPKEVRIGDEVTHEWRYDSQAHSVTLTVPDAVKNWTVRLTQ